MLNRQQRRRRRAIKEAIHEASRIDIPGGRDQFSHRLESFLVWVVGLATLMLAAGWILNRL